jgi:hypothetical protein
LQYNSNQLNSSKIKQTSKERLAWLAGLSFDQSRENEKTDDPVDNGIEKVRGGD